MHIKDTPSFADVSNLLEQQCPEDYAAMPKSSTFAFEECNNSKRLRIGRLDRLSVPSGFKVYASSGGGEHSTMRLTICPSNQTLEVLDQPKVELDKPFREVCRYGRLFYAEETRWLRAALYFWFLEAGQIDTLKKYEDFEKHLVNACQMLGRAALMRTGQNENKNSNQMMRETNSPAALQQNRSTQSLISKKRLSASISESNVQSMENSTVVSHNF